MLKNSRYYPLLFTLAVFIFALAISWSINQTLSTSVPVLLLLQLSVVIVALNCNLIYTYSLAVLEAISFNFLFTEPFYTLHMFHTKDVVDLITFIVIAFLIIRVTDHYRVQQRKLNQTFLRNSLLLSVSHDLKTPLTTIIGTLSSLKEYMPVLGENERLELVDCATSDSLRLSQYIDNLLQATKLQHATLNLCLELAHIESIVQQTVTRFPNQNRLSVDVSEHIPPILLSKNLVEQAIFNIVDNALRYTPENKPVEIKCYPNGDQLIVDIRDYGVGLDKEVAKRVFEAFFTQYEPRLLGTGLGMGVAAGIVRAHKGSIESMPVAEGCLIRISFPRTAQKISVAHN
ncbi:hypothetical protein AKJ18_00800 [Vibrio xuii]|nr:hypothetical protein AKJ18_00800 [Vibrio xuii]